MNNRNCGIGNEHTGNEVVYISLPAVVHFAHQGMNDGYKVNGCRWQIVA
jgi:hypothetical protein